MSRPKLLFLEVFSILKVVNNRNYLYGVIFALLNCISLGILGITDKLGIVQSSYPLLFSAQSLFFALIFSLIFALFYFRGLPLNHFKLSISSLILIALIGILGSGIFVLLRYLGLMQSTGTFATLSQIVTTAITALLAWIFLKERLSKSFWLLFLIIIISMYFVSVGKLAFLSIQKGDLIIISGTLFLAASNIFSKKAIQKVNPIILSVGRLLFGSIFLIIVNFILREGDLFKIANMWVVFSGFLIFVAVVGFNFAIKRIGITFATSILMTASAVTMILEFFLLGYHFTLVQIIAALVGITSGVTLIMGSRNH